MRPRYLLIVLAALALLGAALPAFGMSPDGVFRSAARLTGSSEATSAKARRSASVRRNASRALKLAKKADRRAKDALLAALAPVISQQITDETITAADIATDAVESSEIAEGAVGSSEIADGAVSSSEIAEGAVGSAAIADGAVGSAEIAEGAIGSIELADESVLSADIFDETIASADIQDETVTTFDILDNTIASADILDGTIAAGDIAQSVWSNSIHAAGLLTSRPAAAPSTNGYLYFATDDAGGTLYRSNGNAWVKVGAGVSQVATAVTMTNGGQWDDMPSVLTEFDGSSAFRTRFDLSNSIEARVIVNVDTAGSADAKIRPQYSTDQTTWNDLGSASGPSVPVGSAGLDVSSWVSLVAGARGDVYLRIVGVDGDGAADPIFGRIDIQTR